MLVLMICRFCSFSLVSQLLCALVECRDQCTLHVVDEQNVCELSQWNVVVEFFGELQLGFK